MSFIRVIRVYQSYRTFHAGPPKEFKTRKYLFNFFGPETLMLSQFSKVEEPGGEHPDRGGPSNSSSQTNSHDIRNIE